MTVSGQVAGFATLGDARDPAAGGGELYAINVHPDSWGSGAGSALLVAAHAGLADLGHRRAVLWVLPQNARARSFYARHGWVDEGVERVETVQGVTVPEVRYRRSLP